VLLWLAAIFAVSAALRILLASEIRGPFIFLDELAYARMAQSLAQNGHLALFDKAGVSYAPLYAVVLTPIYALHASAPAAYHWIKVVNAVLMSLSVFPIYGIARYVLPRRLALLAAALLALAPLMYYTTLAMSENLAYPLFLAAVWALLATVRTPSARADAVFLVALAAACLARIQFVALFPAALTAVVLASLLAPRTESAGRIGSATRSLRRHWLVLGCIAVVLVAPVAWALTGAGAHQAIGRYANVLHAGVPSPWRILESAAQHLSELDYAVGVIPFVGTLVAAYAFWRHSSGAGARAFASVGVAVTIWLILLVSYDDVVFPPGSELPRIHERYLFYVVPLFLIALLAAARLPAAKAPAAVYGAAAVAATLLPAAIPFGKVVNNTIVADTFGLQIFARSGPGPIFAVHHATRTAVLVAALLGIVAVVVRRRLPALVIAVLVVFLLFSAVVRSRIGPAANGAPRITLPAHHDWVDRVVRPTGDVVLVAGPGTRRLAVLETAFYNLSIKRLYYLCKPAAEADFGEDKLSVDSEGNLREAAGPVRAPYAVVPARFPIRGRVLARNRRGSQLLVAPRDGRLQVPAARSGDLGCR
jgi:hypothetical protein